MTGFGSFSQAAKQMQTVQSEMLTRTKADFVKLARNGLDRVRAEQAGRSGGMVPPHTQTVDGTPGKAIEAVIVPGGIIRFDFSYRWEATVRIVEMLRTNSPRDSGEYANSHVILLNGRPVPISQVAPKLTEADELIVTNTVPYSRRLEVGKNSDGSPFVIDVPPGIYERTKKQAQHMAPLKAMATFRSTFIRLQRAYRLRGSQRKRSFGQGFARYSARQYSDRVAGAEITYPAIVIGPVRVRS